MFPVSARILQKREGDLKARPALNSPRSRTEDDGSLDTTGYEHDSDIRVAEYLID